MKTAIQPISTQQSMAESNQAQSEYNSEYKRALDEYEKLIRKYPDKKELFYNLGNLNYLGGDFESALQNYRNSLTNKDPEGRAHALYNMGNLYSDQGDLQKSVELFKEALQLAPYDKDIRHNFELSKLMLKQEPPQPNQDKDGEEGDSEEQKKQQNQESQKGDEEEQQKSVKEDQEKNEDSQKQEDSTGEKNKQQSEHSQTRPQEEKEKQLGREEAEAILNALKANESNMKQKKYKASGRIKMEKDW